MNKVADFMTGEFSLILGGPLFQLFRRAHLAGDTLERLKRWIPVTSLFAWLPLLARRRCQ